jgi:hypothetical protein
MATRLEITYDGTVPGLSEHRLSLNAFGPSLNALLRALRRIATNMVGDAVGGNDVAKGRLKAAAKSIDVELYGVGRGSSVVGGVITFAPPPSPQFPLFADVADRAAQEFLDSIELEARGVMRNSGVRGYLRSLPPGLTKHVYTYHNTRSSRTVTLQDVSIPSVAVPPVVREQLGVVVGVGFEPGRNEVRLRHPEGKTIQSFAATEDQVNRAIQFRGTVVRALVLIGGKSRILRLEAADAGRYEPTVEDREKLIFERWHGVLNELAR